MRHGPGLPSIYFNPNIRPERYYRLVKLLLLVYDQVVIWSPDRPTSGSARGAVQPDQLSICLAQGRESDYQSRQGSILLGHENVYASDARSNSESRRPNAVDITRADSSSGGSASSMKADEKSEPGQDTPAAATIRPA